MSPLARVVFICGLYVVVAGLAMMLVLGEVLEVLGVVITGEPWVHLAGYLAVMIGVYFLVAARVDAETFFGVAVPLRLVSGVVLVGKRCCGAAERSRSSRFPTSPAGCGRGRSDGGQRTSPRGERDRRWSR